MSAIERASEIVIAAVCLLDAARPIAALLPCSIPRKEQVEALAGALAALDAHDHPEVRRG